MDGKLECVLEISEKAFQIEQERMKNLSDKAEKYISAIAVIIGFQLLDINSLDLIGFKALHNWLAVAGLLLLGIAFADAFISNHIQDYKSYPDGATIKSVLEDESIDEHSAKTAFTDTYLEAFEANFHINNKRAKLLERSGNLITAGFGLIVARYILEMIMQ